MANVNDIYTQLAPRINYPLTPTYRCKWKIIGFINLLLSYCNTPQEIQEVELQGQPGARYYISTDWTRKISYLKSGKPCKLNPDGTINTAETTGFIIQKGLFKDLETNVYKDFVTSETDVLVDEKYTQALLTSLYLIYQGVQPVEAAMYLNDACTKGNSEMVMKPIDLQNIKRRI